MALKDRCYNKQQGDTKSKRQEVHHPHAYGFGNCTEAAAMIYHS